MSHLEDYCQLTLTDMIATIEFGSPLHNAMSSVMLDTMVDLIHSLDQDLSLKMILIKCKGERTFCAGANLQELLEIQNEIEGSAFFNRFALVIQAMRSSPHLILCRVQGKAIGGGLGIIAAADYVIATDQAQLRLSELSNGIGPFVVGPAIERKIGVAAFGHLALSPGTWIKAETAQLQGLYNELYSDIISLDRAVQRKMEEWSGYSIPALQSIKKMIWSSTPSWESLLQERAAISGRLVMTAEAKAALNKFRKTI